MLDYDEIIILINSPENCDFKAGERRDFRIRYKDQVFNFVADITAINSSENSDKKVLKLTLKPIKKKDLH